VPLGVPSDGTIVMSTVLIRRVGSEWRGQADPSASRDVEIVISATGGATLTGTGVGGTLRGVFHDIGFGGIVRDVSAEVSQGLLEGEVHRGAPLASGRLVGRIVFSDSEGNASECEAVEWILQPTSGILIH
jgi:hypothetical protein